MRYELWPAFELPTRGRLGDGALLIGREGKQGGISLTTNDDLPLLSPLSLSPLPIGSGGR